MNLTDSDIKAIANNRFNKVWNKRMIKVALGMVVLFLAFFIGQIYFKSLYWVVLLPVLLFFVYFLWWNNKQGQFVKKFLAEYKESHGEEPKIKP